MSKKEKNRGKYKLQLKKKELIHLRDLMTVMIQSAEGPVSISSQLNDSADSSLWKKVWDLLVDAGVASGDTAPDFLITFMQTPYLGVVNLTPQVEDMFVEVGDEGVDEQ